MREDLSRLPKALIFGTTEEQAFINQYFGTERCYDWAAVKAKYLCLVNLEEVTVKGCRDGMRKHAWMSTKLAMGTRLL
jgi:hypothetical protein